MIPRGGGGGSLRPDHPVEVPYAASFQVVTLPRDTLFTLSSLPSASQDALVYRRGQQTNATTGGGATREEEEEEDHIPPCAGAEDDVLKCVYLHYPHKVSLSSAVAGSVAARLAAVDPPATRRGGPKVPSEVAMDVEAVVTVSLAPLGADAASRRGPHGSTSTFDNMDGFFEHSLLLSLQGQQATSAAKESIGAAYFGETLTAAGASHGGDGGQGRLETRMDCFSPDGDDVRGTGRICSEMVACQQAIHSLFANVC